MQDLGTILYEWWICTTYVYKNYDISSTYQLPVSLLDYVPKTFFSTQEWRRTDLWNYLIYLEILKEIDVEKKIFLEPLNIYDNNLTYLKDTIEGLKNNESNDHILSLNVKEKIYYIFNQIFQKISYKNDFFVSRSMLGRMNEIKLMIKLRQIPATYTDIFELKLNEYNFSERDWSFSFKN